VLFIFLDSSFHTLERQEVPMLKLAGLPLPLDFAPMEAKLAATLPTQAGWRFEPKWDGFRCPGFSERRRDRPTLQIRKAPGP
jgi:ATP-dependent DNA ligase